MLITICDKCGSRIEENKGRFIFETDFCPDCTEKLKQVVQAWIDESEEDPKAQNIDIEVQTPGAAIYGIKFPEKIKEVSEEDFKKIADQVRKDVENEIAQNENAIARKKIDWNKACALKLAGWSNKDIAMELHATEGTINSGIYSKLKTYKPGQHYDD